jgi:hypothetical protein
MEQVKDKYCQINIHEQTKFALKETEVSAN